MPDEVRSKLLPLFLLFAFPGFTACTAAPIAAIPSASASSTAYGTHMATPGRSGGTLDGGALAIEADAVTVTPDAGDSGYRRLSVRMAISNVSGQPVDVGRFNYNHGLLTALAVGSDGVGYNSSGGATAEFASTYPGLMPPGFRLPAVWDVRVPVTATDLSMRVFAGNDSVTVPLPAAQTATPAFVPQYPGDRLTPGETFASDGLEYSVIGAEPKCTDRIYQVTLRASFLNGTNVAQNQIQPRFDAYTPSIDSRLSGGTYTFDDGSGGSYLSSAPGIKQVFSTTLRGDVGPCLSGRTVIVVAYAYPPYTSDPTAWGLYEFGLTSP